MNTSANVIAESRVSRYRQMGWWRVWHELSKPRNRDGYLMLVPSIVIFLVFSLYPVFDSLYLSLHDYNLLKTAMPFSGVQNYVRAFQDRLFWNALLNNITYTGFVVPLRAAAGLLLALVLNQNLLGRVIVRSILFIPHIASMVVVSLIWLFVLDKDMGIISILMKSAGLTPIAWLREPSLALPALMVMAIWKSVGYEMMVFLAGLQGIPDSYYEAAAIDGANGRQMFWHITLPMLSPTIIFILTISVIGSFQVFDQIYVMTDGTPLHRTETLVYYVFYHAFQTYRMGYASALAYVLFAVTLGVTLVQFWSAGYLRKEES